MLVDMHAKTSVSKDVSVSLEDVLQNAADAGLEGVAFCEHLSTFLCEDAIEMGRSMDITVFIGIEIPTDKGLLLGFTPDVDDFYLAEEWRRLTDATTPPAEAVFDLFDERDGAVIAARPYDLEIPFNMGDHIFTLDKLNGVEAFNSRVGQIQRDFALEAASFMGVSTTGGSDPTDSVEPVGQYATFFEDELTTQRDLVDALRESDYHAVQIGEPKTKRSSRSRASRGGRR
jgi:predicted metal-dependent phosphoesterase TrpH